LGKAYTYLRRMLAFLFAALLLPQVLAYCYSGNTVEGDSNLGEVFLAGDTINIVDDTNCPGQIGLVNKTDLVADISFGRNYLLRFNATTCQVGWARLAYAYIDFNRNNVYDASELLGQRPTDNTRNPIPIEFSFTPPADVSFGRTNMRVSVVESSFAPDPCVVFMYGQVKEFSIDITAVAPTPKYCPAGPTVADGSNLGAVTLVGEQRPSIMDSTDCPGVVGLRNLTNQYTIVMPGGSYQVELDVTTCNGKGYPRYAYAFIDYNGNTQYESTELLGQASVGSGVSPITLRFPFQVPCRNKGSVPGMTRMRVFVVEGGRSPDPCLVFAYGGAKEFSISILPEEDESCSEVSEV